MVASLQTPAAYSAQPLSKWNQTKPVLFHMRPVSMTALAWIQQGHFPLGPALISGKYHQSGNYSTLFVV